MGKDKELLLALACKVLRWLPEERPSADRFEDEFPKRYGLGSEADAAQAPLVRNVRGQCFKKLGGRKNGSISIYQFPSLEPPASLEATAHARALGGTAATVQLKLS